MRLWVDTDVGTNPDDAVALVVAHAHPAIDLALVSTVSGDVGRRARLARELTGETVRVVAGSDGLAEALDAADVDATLAIGPLTNIAGVGWAGAEATLMGGVLDPTWHRGRRRDVESNFGADPRAAAAALSVAARRVVPLDVTSRMVLTVDEVDALRERHPALARSLDSWDAEVCLHDPLALLIAAGDVACDERVERIMVDGGGRLVRGVGEEHRVVVDADVVTAKRRVFDLLTA